MAGKRKTTRRQFLQGHSAVEAVGDLAQGQGTVPEPATRSAGPGRPAVGSYLFQISRAAMACQFQIYLNAGQHPDAPEQALEALDLIEALEEQLSVFREHSQISQINARAAREAVLVEPRLFELLERSVALYYQTEGAFDITSGPLWKLWGFHRRAGCFPAQADIDPVLRRVGSGHLQLCPEHSTLRFLQPGLEINLGGIGKGYALDRCGELFAQQGVDNYVIHGGLSSILARGSRLGLPEGQAGWSVALRHPLRAERRLAEIWLRDQALGTSGSANQFFYHQGRRYSHILDPRSGWPAEGVLSATVLAPNAALADALSTAFFVLGLEKSVDYCHQHPELAALIVCPGPRSGSVRLHPIGLDESQWKPLEGM